MLLQWWGRSNPPSFLKKIEPYSLSGSGYANYYGARAIADYEPPVETFTT